MEQNSWYGSGFLASTVPKEITRHPHAIAIVAPVVW
jgi:hypothetical protein